MSPLAPTPNWRTAQSYDGIAHVHPTDEPHTLADDCWCGPCEREGVVVHRKAVGRAKPGWAAELDAKAADGLRRVGWTVIAPVDPAAAIPAPKPGQVWVSPKPRVEARTVHHIGTNLHWPGDGPNCIYFTYYPGTPRDERPHCLRPSVWLAWVRKSGARPQETTA